jgi:hypothetical protein
MLLALGVGLALLWAGLCLGGNVIAAAAKFSVLSLELADLLRVGRAQFAALDQAELGFLVALCLVLSLCRRWPPMAFWGVCLGFFAEQLLLLPLVEARSDLIFAGKTPAPSRLHLWLIALELGKITALLWLAGQLAAVQRRVLLEV